MALIELSADFRRIDATLRLVLAVLSRIADALDRAVPPQPTGKPYQAKLSDLRRPSPAAVQALDESTAAFAQDTQTIAGSEAFTAAMVKYERDVREAYGDAALDFLPWNQLGFGRRFTPKEEGSQPRSRPEAQPDAEDRPAAATTKA